MFVNDGDRKLSVSVDTDYTHKNNDGRSMLAFLQPELASETINLFKDIQGAIAMTENPINGGREKCFNVRYNFIRELVEHNVLSI